MDDIPVITPEIIPNEIKRFRPIRTGDENSKYCSKEKFARRLITEIEGDKTRSRSVATINKWIILLLENEPNFYRFYKPEQNLNDYVMWCLEQIHQEDLTLPKRGRGNPKIIAEFVKNNIHLFSAQRYQELLRNEHAKEQPIDSAKAIIAA
ncbi:hypothetical protein [Planktothrix pseudagardhii]|uniref:Uncharacterized protein n=1 Tax=Planktothrix pseudagardhii TaxID=132604 RepID=A0A9W4CU83_9CYAN|nr:hypothetical protein [Planktothrix pseudagardhii]CAD5988547.1 hypothetical protein NO713_05733 [Planktothrix pseudagardhii]